MGSSQSVRKLTISNEGETDVIKVSDAVVQRLIQASSETSSEVVKEIRPAPPPPATTTKVTPPQLPRSGDVFSGYPVYYYPELTLTALQIQQQKEQELQAQNIYWQKRLKDLENHHSKINQIMQEEYKKAVGNLYTNEKKSVNIHDTVQPCLEYSGKVLKCYQDNPKQTLECASLVEEFTNCVDQRRARVIAARC